MHHLSLSNRFTSSSPNPSSPIKSTTHGLFALLPVRTNEPPTPASAGIAVDALREIGRKLGKLNWDFERDPCLGWEISSSGAYSNNLTCSVLKF